MFIGKTGAEAPILWPPDTCEELTHWKRPWSWEGLKAGGEGDNRGWDEWMASPTQWTWVWASSGSWWWTGRPGVLHSMGLRRVWHDWATGLDWLTLVQYCRLQMTFLETLKSRAQLSSSSWFEIRCCLIPYPFKVICSLFWLKTLRIFSISSFCCRLMMRSAWFCFVLVIFVIGTQFPIFESDCSTLKKSSSVFDIFFSLFSCLFYSRQMFSCLDWFSSYFCFHILWFS